MHRTAIYTVFVWHGFFLALTLSMIDFNTVLPSLLSELTDSKTILGFLYSILLGAPYVFNVVFGHVLASRRYRRKFLLSGIYLRSLAFLGMAGFTFWFAVEAPALVVGSFFGWIALFSLSGGFAGLAYADIIGKLAPKGERGRLYATKQFASGLASLLGGLIVARIFNTASLGFPRNYALSFLIGFVGLLIAAIAFWFIREPPSPPRAQQETLVALLRRVPTLLRRDAEFRRFIVAENLSSFSLMILPFYMVFAKETFAIRGSYVGRYLVVQMVGALLSNALWATISDRWGSRAVVRACMLVGGLLPVVALSLVPLGPDGFLLVFLLVGMVYSGRRVGFEPYLLDIAPDAERPIYLGVGGTLNILVALLPPLGGAFIDLVGYPPVFGLVTAAMSLAFFLLGKRPVHRS